MTASLGAFERLRRKFALPPPPADSSLSFQWMTCLVVGYIVIQVAANLTVIKTTPIISSHAIPVGSLLFALSYTWIDLINEYLGKSRARWLVIISIAANVLMVLWFELYIHIPGTDHWESNPTNQDAIELVLGSVPRILAASLIANFVVENTDITIYHWCRSRFPKLPKWFRGALSNTVSAPLDGFLFAILAFYGSADTEFVMSVAITSAVYKLTIAYASLPLLYVIRVRQREYPSSTKPAP